MGIQLFVLKKIVGIDQNGGSHLPHRVDEPQFFFQDGRFLNDAHFFFHLDCQNISVVDGENVEHAVLRQTIDFICFVHIKPDTFLFQ